MVKRLFEIYLQLKEAEKKQKQLDKMKANPLNYGIIRDLVNSAQRGVEIEVKMVDGVTLTIKQDQQMPRQPLFGENF